MKDKNKKKKAREGRGRERKKSMRGEGKEKESKEHQRNERITLNAILQVAYLHVSPCLTERKDMKMEGDK